MNICPKCGLPKIACTCETIAKKEQRIRIRTVKRKFGKLTTLIDGIDTKSVNIKDIAKNLKQEFVCGGTVKGTTIELQGDHKSKIKGKLIELGFSADMIEVA
mgnify:CR=1 FL=1